ncbi:MAG: ATP-dependent DNA helicase [Deltaproteobacteria bacterium]
MSAHQFDLGASLQEIFGPTGELSRFLPDFNPRPGQLSMAMEVGMLLAPTPAAEGSRHRFLAVEAGTGTGKTLAYLVPAALSRKKVIISTGTKNLQDQILQKEIPFLRQYITPGIRVVCVKGRQNYLCLYRWLQLYASPQQKLFATPQSVVDLAEWIEQTKSGDRAEIPWLEDNAPLWHELSATSSQCLGSFCPQFSDCFITRVRQQAARADLIITNHHLFFSDLVLRQGGHAEALPRYEAVIFDEAHHLEDVAGQYFGLSFSTYQLTDLALDLEKLGDRELTGKKKSGLLNRVGGLHQLAEQFSSLFPRDLGRFPLLPLIEGTAAWPRRTRELVDRLGGLADYLATLGNGGDSWAAMQNRCLAYNDALLQLKEADDPNRVYWFERRKKSVSLLSSPIAVAEELQPFYQSIAAAVFASATLTTAGTFNYFCERLGLPPDTETRIVEAPFSYDKQSFFYVPEDTFPPPGADRYQTAAQQRILDLLLLSSGRALVLFTSLEAMRNCAAFVGCRLPYEVLVQGTAPKRTLLEQFRQDTHSVLLAVASFWEGIDVPGESLSCLIVDKLPFEVPSDPVLQARLHHLREKGANPFMDFQVPRAILSLRQGVGRLIRSISDRGLIAVLDTRLFTKAYGRIFRKSLPPSPVTRSLEEVGRFFAEKEMDTKVGR